MIAIRLQRVGRKGLPQYRVIVQEAQKAPTSGKVVEFLGSYNPHTKEVKIDKELAQKFLDNGAQPSERVAKILKNEGVKLPDWVEFSDPKERKTRNPEKLRKNQPAEEKSATEEDAAEPATPEEEPSPENNEEKTEETATEATEEAKPEEKPAEAEEAQADDKNE